MDSTNPTIASIRVFDKAALFAALKPKFKVVNIEGFGDIRISEIAAGIAKQARERAEESKNDFWVHLLIFCATDLDGKKIFNEDDIPTILDSGNAGIDSLVAAALQVNGYTKAPEEKNLPATTTDASASA
ncbi:MAG: hypothetical protein WA071_17315 [Undibacterium umbellatum]|uniref:hypothetical protein n=1 Tax=Undibacterium umbellatum TaxID=2762300 RepID=UPI003BB79FEC